MRTYPVLENQRRRYAGYLGGDLSFNAAVVYRIEGDVIAPRLVRAIRTVFDRHIGLRTRLIADDPAELRQTAVDTPCEVLLEEVDAELADHHLWEARVDELVDMPFDLLAGPVGRGFVVRLRDGVVFGVAVDHACADGYSIGLLTREIAAVYRGEPLAPVVGDPFACAERQRDFLASAEADAGRAHWAGVFQDRPLAEALARPVAPFACGDRGNAALAAVTLSAADLRSACARHGLTPYLLTVSAVVIALDAISEEGDVTVLSPYVGRSSADELDVIAWLANIVPLRARFDRDAALGEALAAIKAGVYTALDEARLPFNLMQQLPGLELPGWHPWAFVDCQEQASLSFGGVEATEVDIVSSSARPGLWAVSTVSPDGFTLRLRVPGSPEAVDHLTRIAAVARAVLTAAVGGADAPVATFRRLPSGVS
ncbi:condensation domain-containing protein [Streptomyces sp.]|uniref:condensation domain-containing protein n=1 Tax=Streptomyces sp. TaxID=1931 RepID=UPI002F409903